MSASRKLGYETFFAGLVPDVTLTATDSFSRIYNIDWTEGAKFGIPFHWQSTKKQLNTVLRESRPDIVHAHNIFSAKMISEFGIPFVFDDHEYTSVYVRGLAEGVKENSKPATSKQTNSNPLSRSLRKVAWNFLLKQRAVALWSRWEGELLSLSVPTIVTTEKVVEDMSSSYSINRNTIFVVPNLPMKDEAQSLGKPAYHDRLSSVYAGADRFYSSGVYAHRNLNGLSDMFLNNDDIGDLVMIGVNRPQSESVACSKVKVKYTEFLPRREMYNEMFKHSIGLMAFKKHWSHQFKSPNKAYEYAHAGLYVMCTSSFTSVIESFNGNCAVFEDYDDLASQLAYHSDNLDGLYKMRLRSFEYAKGNLIWEKYEENIFRAYGLA
jgi:glycosyltransferase involved in cell wall biosynthesis